MMTWFLRRGIRGRSRRALDREASFLQKYRNISTRALALLFTTVAASEPHRRASVFSRYAARLPRPPSASPYSRLLYFIPIRETASMTTRPRGARPKFVCTRMLVALITGCRRDALTRAREERKRERMSSYGGIVPFLRSAASSRRTAATITGNG